MDPQQQRRPFLLKRENRKDLVAVCAFFAVFGFMLLRISYGVGITDEGFYYTVVQRVLRGDRLIADEWQITQLNSLLEIIPYKLSLLVSGGTTEGLILNVRYLFLFSQLLLGLHFWRRLRPYGYPALFFILVICTFGPHYTFVYYNMALNGAVLLCVELFAAPKPPSRLKLVGLGVAAALVVLSELLLAFAYLGYTLQVLYEAIRKKRGKTKLRASVLTPSGRTWLWLTVGIALTAGAFFLYLFTSYRWNVKDLIDSIPNMFTDYEYNYTAVGENSHLLRVPYYILKSASMFGYAVFGLGFATLFYAAFRRRKGLTPARRGRIFAFATLLLFLAAVHAVFMCFVMKRGTIVLLYVMISGFSLPIMLYCAILLLIAKDPPPRWFAFWQTGVALSVIVDITSDACLGYGGVLALLPASVLFREMAGERFRTWKNELISGHPALRDKSGLRLVLAGFGAEKKARIAEKKQKKKKKPNRKRESEKLFDKILQTGAIRFLRTPPVKMTVLAAICAGAALSVSFWVAQNYAMRTTKPFVERFAVGKSAREPMNCKLESGPLKGIRTTESVAQLYDAMLADAQTIKETSSGPLYIDSRCPIPYLHADLPVGMYSTWYVEQDNPVRVLYYWRLYPERIPDVIYVPYFEASAFQPSNEAFIQEKLDRLNTFFELTQREGKIGKILYVQGVKTLDWNGETP